MAIIRLQGEKEKRNGIYYQVDSSVEPIGAGGMGQVFKGLCVNEHTGISRPVAIKFVFDDLPPQAIDRARREASIQLRNDNLVEMLGFIETEERSATGEVRKHYHIVSELLTGVSLYDVLEGKTTDRDGNDVSFAVKMLQQLKNDSEYFARTIVVNVLSGLMALHDAGYIHRDIDPSNIMLTQDGHIKLIDFGIAKQMNSLTTGDKALTVAGKFMGKPEYAAPELALGDIQHQNQTTDIYAVGILLYQCIVGHTPFQGAQHEILEKQLKSKLPLGIIKNKALRNIISIACEKRQELRYQSSAQMRVALETMNGGASRKMSTSRKATIVATVAMILLAMVGILFLVKHKQDIAREQAELALVEKKKAEVISSINSKIAEADQLAVIGLNPEEENYEQSLMKAYTAYLEIVNIIKRDSVSNVQLRDVLGKMKQIHQSLDTALNTLTVQGENLKELEPALAESYQKRALAVEKFLKTIK